MDLFSLGLKADARDIVAGTKALDAFAAAAKRASTAAERLNEQTGNSLKRMVSTAREAAATQKAVLAQQTAELRIWQANGHQANQAHIADLRRSEAAGNQATAASKAQLTSQVQDYRVWAATGHQATQSHIADLRKMEAAGHQAAAAHKVRLEQQTRDYRAWGASSHQAMQSQIADLRKWEANGHQANQLAKAQAAAARAAAAAQREGTAAHTAAAKAAAAEARALQQLLDRTNPAGAAARRMAADQARLNEALARGTINADQHAAAMRRVNLAHNSVYASAGSLVGRFGALRNAILLLGFGTAAKLAIHTADSFMLMDSKIRLVTNSSEEFQHVQQRLFETAQHTRTAYEDTVNLYARMARSVKHLGVAQNDIIDITQLVNQAFRISGATSAEAAGAVIQFGQSLQSGVLRGQELNSITEQGGRLFDAIVDGIQKVDPALGLTRSNFRKMAEAGVISTQLIIAALKTQRGVVDAEAQRMRRTIGEALVQLQNQFKQAFKNVDTTDLLEGIDELRAVFSDKAFLESVVILATALLKVVEAASKAVKGVADIGSLIAYSAAKVSGVTTRMDDLNAKIIWFDAASKNIGLPDSVKEKFRQWRDELEQDKRLLESINHLVNKTQPHVPGKGSSGFVGPLQTPSLAQQRADADAAANAVKLLETIAKAQEGYAHQLADQKEINRLAATGMDRAEAELTVQMQRGYATAGQIKQAIELKRIEDERVGIAEAFKAAVSGYNERLKAVTTANADANQQVADNNRLLTAGKDIEEERFRIESERAGISATVTEEIIRQNRLLADTKLVDEFLKMDVGADLAAGFDEASQSLGAFVQGFQKLFEVNEAYNKARAEAANDPIKLAKVEAKMQQAQISLYGDLAGAAKGFFKEGSAGYKALQKAETTFRAIQMALAVRAMVMDNMETIKKVANAGISAVAKGAEGVATAFAQMGVYGFIGAAAIVAALAAVGVRLSGGGGSAPSMPTGGIGTGQGTVLGDTNAVSESIANSVEITADAAEKLVGINFAMLQALRSLQTGIVGLGHMFARAGVKYPGGATAENGAFSQFASFTHGGSTLGAIDPLTGAIDGLFQDVGNAIFGGQQHIIGQGLSIGAGSFADYLDNTVVQAVAQLQTEGGWFSDDSVEDIFGTLPDAMSRQFGLVFQSIADTVLSAAGSLGLNGAAITAAFANIDLSAIRIDTSGKTAEEMSDLLNGFFSALLDTVALGVMPNLADFQQAGEGAGETLVRLSVEFQVLQDVIARLNLPLTATLQIADDLATAFGGVSELAAATAAFYDFVLTDAEKLDRETAALTDLFAQLGKVLPDARAGVLGVVQSLDLTTAAGQSAYRAIVLAAGSLDSHYDAVEKAAEEAAKQAQKLADDERKRLDDLAKAAEEAARKLAAFLEMIRQVRESLERAIVGLRGGSLAAFDLDSVKAQIARAKDSDTLLSLIGPLQGALQAMLDEQIKGIEDAADAARQKAQDNADRWTDALRKQRDVIDEQIKNTLRLKEIAKGMRDYLRELRFGEFAAPAGRLSAAQGELSRLARLAKGGDADAAGKVTGGADTVLKLALESARTREEFERIKASVIGVVAGVAGSIAKMPVQEQLLTSIDNRIKAIEDWLATRFAAIDAKAAADVAAAKAATALELSVLLDAVTALETLGPEYIGPLLTTIRNRLILGFAGVTGAVDDLGEGLTIELATGALDEATKIINFVAVTDSLPPRLKELALDHVSRVRKTVNFVIGRDLPEDVKQIAILNVSKVAKVVRFALSNTALSNENKELALLAGSELVRTVELEAGLGAEPGAKLRQIALMDFSTKMTRTLELLVGPMAGPLSPLRQMILAESSTLVRRVNAAIGANNDPEAKDLILKAANNVTSYVNAALQLEGPNAQQAMELALLQVATVDRTVNAIVTGGGMNAEQKAVLEGIALAAEQAEQTLKLDAAVALNPDDTLLKPLTDITALEEGTIRRTLWQIRDLLETTNGYLQYSNMGVGWWSYLGYKNLSLLQQYANNPITGGPTGKSMEYYAKGGDHKGGWRIVGEEGPELEATGPSRIFSASQTRSMLNTDDLSTEVAALRSDMNLYLHTLTGNSSKSLNMLRRFDGDGLPPEREAD